MTAVSVDRVLAYAEYASAVDAINRQAHEDARLVWLDTRMLPAHPRRRRMLAERAARLDDVTVEQARALAQAHATFLAESS